MIGQRRTLRRARAALVGIVAVALASCGTTVRHHQVAAGIEQSPAGDLGTPGAVASGTSGPAATSTSGGPSSTGDAGATAAATGGTATGTTTTVTTGTGTTTTTRPGASAGATTAPKGTAATRAPSTAASVPSKRTSATKAASGTPVQIGFGYFSDIGAYSASFGGSADAGDEKTEIQTAVDYVNAHGGLDGHPIQPVWAAIQLTSPQPYSTEEASICSTWTQDNHVVMGIFVGAAIENTLATCLNNAGVAFMSGGGYLRDKTDYQNLPNVVAPIEVSTEVWESALLNYLLESGWLTSKDKVGVLVPFNEAAGPRTFNNVIVPTLKAKGIAVTSYEVDYASSTPGLSDEESQVSQAELHARADGVTKVLFLKGGTAGLFMKDADAQGYVPKYAVSSVDSPEGLIGAPARQLAGSVGIGWQPGFDVPTYGKTDYDSNPTRRLCKTTIEKPSGQETGELSESAAILQCDAVLALQAAVDKAHAATITGATVIQGFNELGSSYTDAFTLPSTTFGPTRHAGDATFRPLAWSTACTCYAYSGPAAGF
ncbi:MAG TPA: hypothetical protein VHE83_15880 [Mycobacteriales bacterium]|nr:hypothetical protein [Mycobacteriales bacterium]